jgi:formate/nitrite transporter FocA (FNT family)
MPSFLSGQRPLLLVCWMVLMFVLSGIVHYVIGPSAYGWWFLFGWIASFIFNQLYDGLGGD